MRNRPRRPRDAYFADLYCGTGGVGRKIRRRKFRVAFYDIRYGSQFDLTSKANIRRLRRDVRAGRLVGAMIAITCTSWSVARNRTNVRRTAAQPWGVIDPIKPFSERDLASLAAGNLQLRRLLPLLKDLQLMQVPWILENPATSNIWHVPALKRISRERGAEVILVDQCAFGAPWRKRTRLLCCNCDGQDVLALSSFRCHGRGVCDHSGRPHVQLTGSDANGRPLTQRAQTFPTRFASKLCNVLVSRELGCQL